MELESAESVRVLQRKQWLWAWPWARRVAKGVEVKVRQLESWAWADVWTRAEAGAKEQLEERLQARLQAQERAKAEVEEKAHIEALALAGAWGWARAEARKRGESVPSAVADSSKIRDILSDLHRYGVVYQLWHHSPKRRDEYSCIVDVIAPITRLPFELLRQIFLITIDEAIPPPVLMLVCKHWHAIVTSTWASLKLLWFYYILL